MRPLIFERGHQFFNFKNALSFVVCSSTLELIEKKRFRLRKKEALTLFFSSEWSRGLLFLWVQEILWGLRFFFTAFFSFWERESSNGFLAKQKPP